MSFKSLDNLRFFFKTPILDVLEVIGIFFLRLLAAHPGARSAPHPDISVGTGVERGEGATERNLSQLGPWPGELCSQFKP